MFTLAPYSGRRTMRSGWSDFDSLIDQLFTAEKCANTPAAGACAAGWTPAVDIKEEEDRYVVKADVPGVDLKEIDITVENSVLSVKGERKEEHEEKGDGYRRIERRSGSFERRFTLPEGVDAESIKASGRDGVLVIDIPKAEARKPRKISIQ